MGRKIDIDDFLDRPELWETRAASMRRFGLSAAEFDRSFGLVADRHRKIENRRLKFFVPSLWVHFATQILNFSDYVVTADMLTDRDRHLSGDDRVGAKTSEFAAWRVQTEDG